VRSACIVSAGHVTARCARSYEKSPAPSLGGGWTAASVPLGGTGAGRVRGPGEIFKTGHGFSRAVEDAIKI
jgi:hypothetical protein